MVARPTVLLTPGASALFLVALLAHCGKDAGDGPAPSPRDASGPPDSGGPPLPDGAVDGSEPSEACDRTAPFGEPIRVTGLPSDLFIGSPRLSADERTFYVTTVVPDPDGGIDDYQLARVERATTTSASGPVIVMAESSSARDSNPMVGSDNLTLWFQTTRNGPLEVFFSTRDTPLVDWSPPTRVSDVNDGAGSKGHPYYRSSNAELWFISNAAGTWDIYSAPRTLTGFGSADPAEGLNSDSTEFHPMITEDGLTLLFSSDRPNGKGAFDVYVAERATSSEPFADPKPISEINSSFNDYAGWISRDRCRIYFASGREVNDLRDNVYVAERPRP